MISIKKSGIRALLITLFTMLIISSLVVLVKAKNSSGEVKEVEKTTILAQQAWIEVEALTNSENPTDLNVKSGPSTNPPSSPDCNITNAGKPCAAHLSFPGALPPTSIPTGTTLQDLMDDYGATLVLDDNEKPEFTRKDQ